MKDCIAVIQAGGKGTRMREITGDRIPKVMLPIGEKPMLQLQIEQAKKYGIDEVVIIIGHLGDKIRDYFKDGQSFGVQIHYIEEQEPLGSAGALYYLKDFPAEKYFLIFGDVMFDLEVRQLLDFHDSNGAGVTLVVHPNAHPYDSDLLIINDKNQVTGILGKKEERNEYYANIVNSGLFVLGAEVLDFFNAPEKRDLEQDVISKLIPQNKVYGYRTSEYIKDTGTPDRYRKAEADYQNGIWEKKNLGNRQKCVFLDRDGTINVLKGLISKSEQIELYDGVVEAIRMLNSSDYLTIMATNQPVVARGMCSIDEVRMIHNKIETLLGKEGVYLDDIIFCPHHPDKGYPEENPIYKIECECRKPKTGMIREMAGKYNIDLAQSYMVGDTTVDIQTGINAGMKTVLLETGDAGNDGK